MHASKSDSSLDRTTSLYSSNSTPNFSHTVTFSSTTFEGHYGYYFTTHSSPKKSPDEIQYSKLVKKSKDDITVSQLDKKNSTITKLLPLTHLVALQLYNKICGAPVIRFGTSDDLHFSGKQLVFNEGLPKTENRTLINIRYKFTVSSIDMDDIVACINTVCIIFNTTTSDEDTKVVYRDISNKMITLFRLGKEFLNKYKANLECNEVTPVMFNEFDADNKTFLGDLLKLYGLIVDQYLLNSRFSSVLSSKQLTRFNKLVAENCPTYKHLNIGLNLWPTSTFQQK
jgi:hypothetical protein